MDARRFIGPMHDFSRERAESPQPKIKSRASSKARARSRSPSSNSADSDPDDEPPLPRSRKSSTGSVRSRKRSDTQTTTGSAVEAARDRKEREDKKKGSWSVWGRNGSKRDREQFTSLRGTADDESDSSDPERAPGSPTQVSKSASLLSLGKWTKSQQNISTPRIPALGSRTRGRESERQKVVRATSDYLGSSDELSFRTGDEIVVIGEVIDGWMMGELDGKKGLFPTVYTEPISAATRRSISRPSVAPTPPLLQRKLSSKMGSDGATDSLSGSRQTLVDSDSFTSSSLGPRAAQAQVTDTEGEDVNDSSHPFGDHHATTQDTDHEQEPPSSAVLSSDRHSYDSESFAESAADDSELEQSSLVRRRASDDNEWVIRNNLNISGPPKKAPPPLPRRQTGVRKAPPPPPPPRRPDVRASPQPPTYGLHDGHTGDCANFVQAVGRATGMCANCQRMHIE